MKFFYPSLLLFLNLACQGQPLEMDAESFQKAIASDSVQILDVRTSSEYGFGHIKSALQADWTNNSEFIDRVKYLDKNRPVFVYCLVGSRSAAAAKWLRNAGFSRVVELKGGINAWKKVNYPTIGTVKEKQITIEEYRQSIPNNQTLLVDFGANWCPPCVKMEPVLAEIRRDSSLKFQFLKIDAGIHTQVMKELGIEPIPVFIIYKNGKETWRKQGLVTIEEFRKQLQ